MPGELRQHPEDTAARLEHLGLMEGDVILHMHASLEHTRLQDVVQGAPTEHSLRVSLMCGCTFSLRKELWPSVLSGCPSVCHPSLGC